MGYHAFFHVRILHEISVVTESSGLSLKSKNSSPARSENSCGAAVFIFPRKLRFLQIRQMLFRSTRCFHPRRAGPMSRCNSCRPCCLRFVCIRSAAFSLATARRSAALCSWLRWLQAVFAPPEMRILHRPLLHSLSARQAILRKKTRSRFCSRQLQASTIMR